MVDLRGLEPVHQRSAQRRAFFAERGDGLRHLGRRVQILLDQGSEPRGVFVGDLHGPGHTRLLI